MMAVLILLMKEPEKWFPKNNVVAFYFITGNFI
jgi:hypothetical protein